MDREQKERVIGKIAAALDGAGVVWGAGASYMLYKRGVVGEFNDLDIIVEASGAPAASAALSALGTAQKIEPNAGYETDFFAKYMVDGLGVDLMCGFSVVTPGGPFNYLFDSAALDGAADLGGRAVKLARLGDWLMLYSLMQNRQRRVAAIKQYYKVYPPTADELLQTALFTAFGFMPRESGAALRARYLKDPAAVAASLGLENPQ